MLTGDERVALDRYGAQVYQIGPGLWEVACHSHATQLIGGEHHRPYLERRAQTHNKNWHPDIEERA